VSRQAQNPGGESLRDKFSLGSTARIPQGGCHEIQFNL
jgi:hypothetical protein